MEKYIHLFMGVFNYGGCMGEVSSGFMKYTTSRIYNEAIQCHDRLTDEGPGPNSSIGAALTEPTRRAEAPAGPPLGSAQQPAHFL